MKQNLFRENLRKFRENVNLTQKAFAEQLGINVTTYRNYENSNREPDFDTLLLICRKLNVSVDTMLGSTSSYSNDLIKLCKLYNTLDSRNQGALIERAEVLLELQDGRIKYSSLQSSKNSP
ncbi:helix-turn-helix domain-containing protein [Aminipila terrae]|uniref:Helix-turn-helix domain-containing protein n=1 Tax=Aminipila terrae TaxID=2697030 RepID=A0A6P1MFX3_9FIRM|nr:helix-turn-helix transcriptional regulator [Aminipila terrae]QHI73600.1 helix-turn-helix domain-containing protein [Aminipila terrae]